MDISLTLSEDYYKPIDNVELYRVRNPRINSKIVKGDFIFEVKNKKVIRLYTDMYKDNFPYGTTITLEYISDEQTIAYRILCKNKSELGRILKMLQVF